MVIDRSKFWGEKKEQEHFDHIFRFCLVHITKLQRDGQDGVLLTVICIPVFPNIATTKTFHVHGCELFLPECLLSVDPMINRRWC